MRIDQDHSWIELIHELYLEGTAGAGEVRDSLLDEILKFWLTNFQMEPFYLAGKRQAVLTFKPPDGGDDGYQSLAEALQPRILEAGIWLPGKAIPVKGSLTV